MTDSNVGVNRKLFVHALEKGRQFGSDNERARESFMPTILWGASLLEFSEKKRGIIVVLRLDASRRMRGFPVRAREYLMILLRKYGTSYQNLDGESIIF